MPVLLASFGWRAIDRLSHTVRSLLDTTACRAFQIATDRCAVVFLDRGGRTHADLAQAVRQIVADAQLGARCRADVPISLSIGMPAVGSQTQAGADHLLDQVLALGQRLQGRGHRQLAIVAGDADLDARMVPLRWVMRIRQAIEQALPGQAWNDFVQQLLDEQRVDLGTVCFEITESTGIVGFEQASRSITELRRRGLRFALDAFGSGMASLSYLRDRAANATRPVATRRPLERSHCPRASAP